MIFYFSATGNSRHVAQKIAEKTGDKVISIVECVQKMHYDYKLQKGERLGFVYPVYYWGLPSLVEEFLDNISIERYGKNYTYSVATCGVTTGAADMVLSKKLGKRGIGLHATFALKMVDTYTIVFNVKNTQKNNQKNDEADEHLKDIIFLVCNRTGGYYNKLRGLWPASKIAHATYNMTRVTSPFKVSNDCIGCGICAKNCPTSTISTEFGKPVWNNKKCAMCFSCIHRCPVNAISYGPTTKKNGQYVYEES